jgi:hypothetical protein
VKLGFLFVDNSNALTTRLSTTKQISDAILRLTRATRFVRAVPPTAAARLPAKTLKSASERTVGIVFHGIEPFDAKLQQFMSSEVDKGEGVRWVEREARELAKIKRVKTHGYSGDL